MKRKIYNVLKWLTGYNKEYTKNEMSLVTRVVLVMAAFIMPLILLLLVLHIKLGLSYRMVVTVLTNYRIIVCTCVTGYFAAFIAQMGKALLAKINEEKNKLEKEKKEG